MNLAEGAKVTTEKNGFGQATVEIKLPEQKKLSYIVLREKIELGQRIESFKIFGNNPKRTVFDSSTVGNMKICKVNAVSDTVTIKITASRGEPLLEPVEIY